MGFFLSFLTDFNCFQLNLFSGKLQDMVSTDQKWTFFKDGGDGFNYFSFNF